MNPGCVRLDIHSRDSSFCRQSFGSQIHSLNVAFAFAEEGKDNGEDTGSRSSLGGPSSLPYTSMTIFGPPLPMFPIPLFQLLSIANHTAA